MITSFFRSNNKLSLFIFVLFFLLFSTGISLHTINPCYFLLLLIAIARLFYKNNHITFKDTYRSFKLTHWAMASMLIALILSQIGNGFFSISPYNAIVRFATFCLIFWLAINLNIELLQKLKWAWIVGVIASAIHVYSVLYDAFNRPAIQNWYIGLASLLGVFSILSIAWQKNSNKLKIALHLLGGIAGLYIVFISQTRGVWIALPLYMLMVYLTFIPHALSIKKIGIFALFLIISGTAFFNTHLAQDRIAQIKNDIHLYSLDKNAQSSIGTRFQLWNTSLVIIKEHPIFGVGAGQPYKDEIKKMVERKVIPTYYNGAHSHNEILYSTATMGVGGFIAILLIYFVPLIYFGKHLLHPDKQLRSAAAMGVCVCAGFMIFGLVDVLFYYKECEVFYIVAIAVFMAFIVNKKKQINLNG